MNVQADLTLHWVHLSEGTFSDVAAQIPGLSSKEISRESFSETTVGSRYLDLAYLE